MAATTSGPFGSMTATASPGRTPASCRRDASRRAAARSVGAGDLTVAGVDRHGGVVARPLVEQIQQARHQRGPGPVPADLAESSGCHCASRFSAKARGPSSWSGWPHIETSSSAPSRQASVSPVSSAPHSARLVAAHRCRRVARDLLGELCASSRKRSGGSTICADHARARRPARPTSARDGRPAPSASPPRTASCAAARSPRSRPPGRPRRAGRRTARRRRRSRCRRRRPSGSRRRRRSR